jgi:hypothetical protein
MADAKNRPPTYDHLKSHKKPNTTQIRIALNSDVQEAFEESVGKLEMARMMTENLPEGPAKNRAAVDLVDAQAAFEKAKADVVKNSVIFKFRSIGRTKYDKLINEHPPTPSQKEEFDQIKDDPTDQLAWNPETFSVALVAASLVEPEFTEAEVKDLWEDENWSQNDLGVLFQTALSANTARSVVDLGKD